jgi:predicted GNAT superfamily acetyltransferase
MSAVAEPARSEIEQAAGRSAPDVEVRLVRTHEEFAACESLSRDVWGVEERNIVPRELLLTMQLNGGPVHGAFLPNGRMVGFCFAFAGLRQGKFRLCSHQLGVLPSYRGTGVGIALKLAQKQEAKALGYELISWTFDPLEARNAYINLHRLGCIARLYDRDHYGVMEDDLNRGLPSDRFEAEWWIKAEKPLHEGDGGPEILTVGPDRRPQLHLDRLKGSPQALVQIPSDFQGIKRQSMALAREWRLQSRAAIEAALGAGLMAVDFQREGAYVMAALEKSSPPPST